LGTAFFLGPVFFTILRNSHKYGIKAGFYTAFGILISDVVILLICLTFTRELVESQVDKAWLKWSAAGILLFLSYRFLTNPNKTQYQANNSKLGAGNFISFYQGFLVNFVNPFVFVVWIGFISLAHSITNSDTEFYTFLIAILIGIFITDGLKAFASQRILHRINQAWVSYLYKVLGIILIAIAMRLILLALKII
jgi:threonine/homoserine/homoserine lactone efflux protein